MKQTTKSAVCAALLLCLLTGCGARQTTASQISEQHASSKQPPVSAARSEKASSSAVLQAVSSEASAASSQTEEQTELDNMTLSQKVGQLFFLCFRKDTDGTNLFTYNDTVKNTIQAIQAVSFCLEKISIQLRRCAGSFKICSRTAKHRRLSALTRRAAQCSVLRKRS